MDDEVTPELLRLMGMAFDPVSPESLALMDKLFGYNHERELEERSRIAQEQMMDRHREHISDLMMRGEMGPNDYDYT